MLQFSKVTLPEMHLMPPPYENSVFLKCASAPDSIRRPPFRSVKLIELMRGPGCPSVSIYPKTLMDLLGEMPNETVSRIKSESDSEMFKSSVIR